jgi:hypothetical protein
MRISEGAIASMLNTRRRKPAEQHGERIAASIVWVLPNPSGLSKFKHTLSYLPWTTTTPITLCSSI